MQYYVIAPDGQRYGPADISTLNTWIAEGRLLPETQLQDAATGAVMAASTVPGLQFPMAPGAAPQAPMATPPAGPAPGFDVPGTALPQQSDEALQQPEQPQQSYQAPQQPYQAPQQPYQAPQQPQQPYQAPQQPYQQPYQQPGPFSQPPGSNYPRPTMSADDGSGDIQKAYIFGAISFLCCPIIFGVLGIIYAIQAKNKGNPRAQSALIFAIAGLVGGIFIGVFINIALGGLSRF